MAAVFEPRYESGQGRRLRRSPRMIGTPPSGRQIPVDPADHAEDFSRRWVDRLDEYTRDVLYRSVYGHVRDRAARFYGAEPVEAIRADPIRGIGRIDLAILADPESAEAI